MAENRSEKPWGSAETEESHPSTSPDPLPVSQNDEERDPLPTDSMVTVPLSDIHTGSRISGEGPALSDAAYCPDSVSAVGLGLESPRAPHDDGEVHVEGDEPASEPQDEAIPPRAPPILSLGEARSIAGSQKSDTDDSRSVDWAGLEETEVNESKASGDDVVSRFT